MITVRIRMTGYWNRNMDNPPMKRKDLFVPLYNQLKRIETEMIE